MYNLHCHSLLSDGALLPSEVAVRFAAKGFKAIAITDHADYSNIEPVVRGVLEFSRRWPKKSGLIKVLPGIELTHLPLEQFAPLAKYAREEGIKVIIGHGETPAEPVVKGTNRAALSADIDILAHPGRISDEDVKLARDKGILLEITCRRGHSDTNAHVAEKALKQGAGLIINIDSHAPEDIIAAQEMVKCALSCGLTQKDIDRIYKDVEEFLKKKEA